MKYIRLAKMQRKFEVLLLLLMLISGCTTVVGTTSATLSNKKTEETYHYVKKGENLFRISKYYYDLETTPEIHKGIDRIKKANNMSSQELSIGQKILIPGTNKKQPPYALTPPISTISEPVNKKPTPLAPTPLPSKDSSQSDEPLLQEQPTPIIKDKVFQWPVKGRIICTFGELGNEGIDIVVEQGNDVLAADSGKVVFTGTTAKHQETIIIEHQNNIYTIYGHDIEILTKQGSNINKGDVIARMKQGTHRIRYLHFEMRIGSVSVNPLFYLPQKESNGR